MAEVTATQKEIAGWVLHYYGVPGHHPPGGFTSLILQAYQKADPGNKARLRLGFPEIAEAMDLVMYDEDGINKLAARTE